MFNRRVVITSDGVPAPGGAWALRIIGLSEVDHYCAAYVQSDAAFVRRLPRARHHPDRGDYWPWRGPGVEHRPWRCDGFHRGCRQQRERRHWGRCGKQEPRRCHGPAHRRHPTPTNVETLVTCTVLDQFKKPMGADICIDKTMTLCFASHPAKQSFRDSATNAAGQVDDQLALSNPGGIPVSMCRKFDQVITAGGCGDFYTIR